MVTKALLEGSLSGVGKLHRTSIFPCGIFQYKKGVNDKPGTPNYDLYQLALKSTAFRLYPNYANCDWSVDEASRQLDIKHKKEVLSKLSGEQLAILGNWIKDNEDEARRYKLIYKNDQVSIDENFIDIAEIVSTMGKCKLQLI